MHAPPAYEGLTHMSLEIPGVLWRRDPQAAEVPLIFDSPHSGTSYPEDFQFSCPFDVLRTAEDTYVDELYSAAPACGATLIGAVFPRSYLDPNRAVDDLDAALIDGTWPSPLAPSHKTQTGLGSPGPAFRSTTASSESTKFLPGSSAAIRLTTGFLMTLVGMRTVNSEVCGI